MPVSKAKKGYNIIELGKPAIEIRKKFKIDFLGVSDISLNELAKMTDLSIEDARRMAQRELAKLS